MTARQVRGTTFRNTMITGFFGGVMFAIMQLIFFYFNISEIDHQTILKPFFITGVWLSKWYGYLFFLLFIGLLSMLLAVMYYGLCKSVKGWWLGALFGVFLWGVCYLLLPLFIYNINTMTSLSSHTTVSLFCLLLLYGIFIGYSIAYDYEITFANNSANEV